MRARLTLKGDGRILWRRRSSLSWKNERDVNAELKFPHPGNTPAGGS
jgi:hypothetical protein